MISVPNNTPKTVSFTQTLSNQTSDIAKSQIGKLSLAETTALGGKENADFHLAKATEVLRLAELAYRESITKSVWNKEELRKAYNNAIAGYRLADKNAQKAAEELSLAKAALAGTRATANGEILKSEFSNNNTEELSPIAESTTKYVLRKDATVTNYAIDPSMGAPMTQGQTDDDVSAQYDKVLCPDCLGFDGNEGCPTCSDVHFIAVMKSAPRTANPFDTNELLTRQFQKSEAYQNYIMKGGKGSGALPGHEFNGNQWTGGMRSFSRGEMAGRKEGWKQTLKRYEGAHDSHVAAGQKATTEAHALEQAGKLREAADKHEEAHNHFMKAHGAIKGLQSVMQRETDNGSHGAAQDKVASYAGRASTMRSTANTSADNVARLASLANKAEAAAAANS